MQIKIKPDEGARPEPGAGPEPRRVLSVTEAAQYLGIGRSLAYKLVANGTVPSAKIGKRRVVRVADLDQFIDKRVRGGRER